MEAVHRLWKIKQERLEGALDAMWRAEGTAFQAKGTASRKALRLEEPGTCGGLKGSLRVATALERPGCGTGQAGPTVPLLGSWCGARPGALAAALTSLSCLHWEDRLERTRRRERSEEDLS